MVFDTETGKEAARVPAEGSSFYKNYSFLHNIV